MNARYMKPLRGGLGWALLLVGMAVVCGLAATAMPVAAQDPTPWPTPIATTDYVVYQTVTYGDGAVILALLLVSGLLLINLIVRITEKLVES